ncbi:MAG: twin-arginine translocation signal domain-containing protein [Candidatus Eremiobacteraeota bacterium]|nr:twin-arginine translocation signal domain-containing protein [Candidatus Eremiobacteraeota bacterium]
MSYPSVRPDLSVTECGDETLVYHPSEKSVHLLTGLSARVFWAARQGTTLPQADEAEVKASLDRLRGLGMFAEGGVSRRAFLRHTGQAAAVAGIVSLALPEPVLAASAGCQDCNSQSSNCANCQPVVLETCDACFGTAVAASCAPAQCTCMSLRSVTNISCSTDIETAKVCIPVGQIATGTAISMSCSDARNAAITNGSGALSLTDCDGVATMLGIGAFPNYACCSGCT